VGTGGSGPAAPRVTGRLAGGTRIALKERPRSVLNTDSPATVEPSVPASANVAGVLRRSKNRQRWLALLLMVAGISSNGLGSTVIVLIRDNNVWMAANSMTSASGKGRSVCQIGQAKGFYWASASPSEAAPEFGIDASMANVQADGTLLQKMKTLVEKSKAPITGELERLRSSDRGRFQNLMKVANRDLVKIIFVGVENHVPTVVWATLVAEERDGRIVVSTDTVKSVIPAEVRDGVVGAGLSKDAISYLAEHHWETAGDPVPLLRESLRAQGRANSHGVGGHVSVLRFSEAGAEWIERGPCQAPEAKRTAVAN
jgi:hypothetical protein